MGDHPSILTLMSNTSTARPRDPTHYDVLQLPRRTDWSRLSKDEIKAAYRRALLIHHPDRTAAAAHAVLNPASDLRPRTPTYSVDEIVVAYEVLVDPRKRAAYDQALDFDRDHLSGRAGAGGANGTHIGVEVYDLEDLDHDEAQNIWSKSCRCGDEQGYILNELDLEKESQHGEIYVGCRGCSLFVKVLFGLDEG